jgi:hypothetical protein
MHVDTVSSSEVLKLFIMQKQGGRSRGDRTLRITEEPWVAVTRSEARNVKQSYSVVSVIKRVQVAETVTQHVIDLYTILINLANQLLPEDGTGDIASIIVKPFGIKCVN